MLKSINNKRMFIVGIIVSIVGSAFLLYGAISNPTEASTMSISGRITNTSLYYSGVSKFTLYYYSPAYKRYRRADWYSICVGDPMGCSTVSYRGRFYSTRDLNAFTRLLMRDHQATFKYNFCYIENRSLAEGAKMRVRCITHIDLKE